MATPSPQTWTLRLKSHKTTVLLHTDPLAPFSVLKTHLHAALAETGLRSSTGATITLPASPSLIQLGRPVDVHDASQGWVLGEWEAAGDDGEDESGKGKGKGKAKAKDARDCPKGAGLKDGAVLAFRFEGDAGEEDAWEVQLASFEDAYGVENEGDVGGGREFEG